MRKSYEPQFRFGATPIAQLQLNLNCRDEIIPVLAALRYAYLDGAMRRRITTLVAESVNEHTRRDTGRPGFDDWQVIVLAVLRMNCNLDYDKLQDLAENHLSLRTVLGVDGWEQDPSFDYRRIRNAICEIKPETIEKINEVVVQRGQTLHGDAVSSARADSFVIETDIHYPTESSLMYDGMRKIIPLARKLADEINLPQWRQSDHLLKKIKQLHRQINQLAASKIIKKKDAMESLYCTLIERVDSILERVKTLEKEGKDALSPSMFIRLKELTGWVVLTAQVRDTAYRRVVLGETVPNTDKLFSLFETHTQLYKRGKAGEPIQYGRLAMIFEDGAGFISHYYLMSRDETDSVVVVEQTKIAQRRHRGGLEDLSLDRGFHSASNIEALQPIVGNVSCPSRNPQNYAAEVGSESDEARRRRHRHAGIESAVGALQRGNGLKRCRDHSEVGLKRYLGLAVLSRNLQVLGKLLIAADQPDANAAKTARLAA